MILNKRLNLMRLLVGNHQIRNDGWRAGPCWDGNFSIIVGLEWQVGHAVHSKDSNGVCTAGLEMRQRYARLRTRGWRRKRDVRRANVTLNFVLRIRTTAFVKRGIPGKHQSVLVQKSSCNVSWRRRGSCTSRGSWIGLRSVEALATAALHRTCVQRLEKSG